MSNYSSFIPAHSSSGFKTYLRYSDIIWENTDSIRTKKVNKFIELESIIYSHLHSGFCSIQYTMLNNLLAVY